MCGRLAQLGEHLPYKQGVAGSSPAPPITPHDARHAHVSELIDLGFDVEDVRDRVGHTTTGVTECIYRHSFNRAQREQRQREKLAALG